MLGPGRYQLGGDRVPWDQFLGERIQEVRQKRGWTQERLALGIRRTWGLGWTRATVTATESGQRELSAKELFALLDVLLITPGELLADPSVDPRTTHLEVSRRSKVGGAGSVTLKVILGVLEGGRRSQFATGHDTPWTRAASGQIGSLPQISGELAAAGVTPTGEACKAVLDGESGEAEKKLAARLGVTPRKVAVQAVKLWGRTLTAEREARLKDRLGDTPDSSAGSLQTTRGHITRELIAVLTHAIAGD